MRESDRAPTVVMVEDEPEFQALVRGWLGSRYGHLGLPNGEGLLDALASTDPVLLILDVNMPGVDGFGLCRQVRSDRRFRELPVLFLTGRKGDEDFMRNLAVGGSAYLTKPIGRRQFLSAVQDLLVEQGLA